MSMKTNLSGRLRNTSLPISHGLLPLFEAVVNSIHSIEEANLKIGSGKITVEIIRDTQGELDLKDKKNTDVKIVGFKISDNGIGFDDANMQSFKTLDSDHKAEKGCRGVGRLLWLKAFKQVHVVSSFKKGDNYVTRDFCFDAVGDVSDIEETTAKTGKRQTVVELQGFYDKYRMPVSKSLRTISKSLLEHCLWYFVRDGGAPKITVRDREECIDLDDLYEEYMHDAALSEQMNIEEEPFEVTHIKFRASASHSHTLSFCASNRLVKEESLDRKIPGLYGKLNDDKGEFVYSCYVSSPFLDRNVRSERTGFDIEENIEGLFEGQEITLKKIREEIYPHIGQHLNKSLAENVSAGKERVEKFIAEKAPKYRPILTRLSEEDLSVDKDISDKDLDIHLHKQLAKLEHKILERGHDILVPMEGEAQHTYYDRVRAYLSDVSDMKKSDLADYLCHRRVIIDLLQKAIEKDENGKYVAEEIIHELIIPMRKDSNEVSPDDCNLWIVDERLAFHDYLASDKTINSMPITEGNDKKEPDILALNIYDNPLLVSDRQSLPLASINVVEIKKPMRNDARAGEDKDPIEQALGYLERIREGKAQTSSGRPIPNSNDIPGYCYIICDLTSSIRARCKLLNLTVTSDHMGFFGYNTNFKAYIEVISYDKLVETAKMKNKAFFDKLGLPTT